MIFRFVSQAEEKTGQYLFIYNCCHFFYALSCYSHKSRMCRKKKRCPQIPQEVNRHSSGSVFLLQTDHTSEVRTDFALPMKEVGKGEGWEVGVDCFPPLYTFLLHRSLIDLLLSSELINVRIHGLMFFLAVNL